MRGLSVRNGVAVLPRSLVEASNREVEIKDTDLLIVYPDDTKGSELDEILRASADVIVAAKGGVPARAAGASPELTHGP